MKGVQGFWFAVMLLAASGAVIFQGARIVLRREIDTPFVAARGGKALAIGLAVLAVGLLGAVLSVVEGLKARG